MLQPWLDARGLGSNTQARQKLGTFYMHTFPTRNPSCGNLLYYLMLLWRIAGSGLLCCIQER